MKLGSIPDIPDGLPKPGEISACITRSDHLASSGVAQIPKLKKKDKDYKITMINKIRMEDIEK